MKVRGGSYDYWNPFFLKTQGKREEDFFVKV